MKRKSVAFALSLVLAFGAAAPAFGASLEQAKMAETIFEAADAYNEDLVLADLSTLLPDDETGALTRLEAFVLLSRAFGTLPEAAGNTLRTSVPTTPFTDVPAEYQADIENLRQAGVIAGVADGRLGANDTITDAQLDTVIRRIWACLGTNPADDFYAAVNQDYLAFKEPLPGSPATNAFTDVQNLNNERIGEIITDIAKGTYEAGTVEQKISDYYQSVLDMEGRNAAGVAPVQAYLTAIDEAASLAELEAAQITIARELAVASLLGASYGVDLGDSSQYILYFGGIAPTLPKTDYLQADGAAKTAFVTYLATMLTLAGEAPAAAQKHAEDYFALEAAVSAASLDPQDQSNVDLVYNLYTLEELQEMFPNADLQAILAGQGYDAADEKLILMDVGAAEAFAAYYTEENLELLKTAAKLSVLSSYAGALSQDFTDASNLFSQTYYGYDGSRTPEETALLQVQNSMSEYLGELFVEKYFSPEAKADVEAMVREFIEVYKTRIQALDWMSDETKAMALKKLEAMDVHIGYPDTWESLWDGIDVKNPENGGSFFENVRQYSLAGQKANAGLKGKPVDNSAWTFPAYLVNAFNDLAQNSIWFPAGILQAPFYDVEASREQNLGAIGAVIAHEITHAFDNNGAKFDENGSVANWWTEEDYAAFQALCEKAAGYFDGMEIIPGVVNNGTLTLSENVADLGGLACALQVAEQMDNPDYEAFFTGWATVWRMVSSREYTQYLAQIDVHSADKVRANLGVANLDQFYTTFGIEPGDGMYIAPEDRVTIW